MKVRVLGCSGAIAAGCKTTSFLLDDDLLVDAGTGVGDLTLDELARINHILVTHSHLDHIVSIPLLVDSVMNRRTRPIVVHALPATIEALRAHILNWVIWPDFTQLPTRERPVLQLGLPDHFIDHGDSTVLLRECGLDADGIAAAVRRRFPELVRETRVKSVA